MCHVARDATTLRKRSASCGTDVLWVWRKTGPKLSQLRYRWLTAKAVRNAKEGQFDSSGCLKMLPAINHLINRIRGTQDRVSAQIDDVCSHVFLPVHPLANNLSLSSMPGHLHPHLSQLTPQLAAYAEVTWNSHLKLVYRRMCSASSFCLHSLLKLQLCDPQTGKRMCKCTASSCHDRTTPPQRPSH